MYLVRTREWAVAIFVLGRWACLSAAASTKEALSVSPSTQWYGDDGTWSAISIRVGTPPQWVDVMVNTVSSETWVVGPAGCPNNEICTQARGGLYDLSTSSTNHDLGFFSLGVDNRLGGQGYAEYGFDTLTFGSTGVSLNSTIIGSVNSTEFFLGMFGVGIVPGNFKNVSSLAAISGLVEKDGAIPSHSYGYTAGAKYQLKGVPTSLTLGGYDANRLVPHNTSFELNPSQNPAAFVNSIFVSSTGTSNNWTTPVQLLSPVDRVTATIDSSTPYLWLPQSVCDSFAQTLGLSYNSTLNLYTFDGNSAQHDTLKNSELQFIITLSDTTASTKLVNITLPYAAFDQQLSFPAIPNTTYGSTESSKNYFPIKRATTEAEYTIGRVFLQEAYIITDYERNTFSVHQAVHTSDPISNTSIISITQSDNSTSTSPPSTKHSKSLSTGAIVGIAIGAVVILALLTFLAFYLWRRKRMTKGTDEDEKPPEATQTQSRGILGRFRRGPGDDPPANEALASTNYPTEVGADASHERFELPAPLGPAELDSEAGTLYGSTENGSATTDSNNMSAYERARRKLERQQAVADHAQSMLETYPPEKTEHTETPVMQYLSPPGSQSHFGTPPISPASGGSNDSMTISGQPSPISPGFVSGPTSPTSPPPTYRRLSPGQVIYAGPLPNNVQLPSVVPRLTGRDEPPSSQEQTLLTDACSTANTSSLGSEYTQRQLTHDDDIYGAPSPRSTTAYSAVSAPSGSRSAPSVSNVSESSSQRPLMRVEDESKYLREDMVALKADMQTREIVDPYKGRQKIDGEDLVHVPVPAERRFSWEDERVAGEGTK